MEGTSMEGTSTSIHINSLLASRRGFLTGESWVADVRAHCADLCGRLSCKGITVYKIDYSGFLADPEVPPTA